MPDAAQTLYQRILGEKFHLLPATLRHFHGSPTGARGTGVLRVQRGNGLLSRIAGRIAGLPPQSNEARVQLVVEVDENRNERWIRIFDDHRLASIQSEENGMLIERMFPLKLGFDLLVNDDTIIHNLSRCWVGPIPLPLFLAPRVSTFTKATRDGWLLNVRVAIPVVGELIQYHGEIRCVE
jgi:hypothetical protein